MGHGRIYEAAIARATAVAEDRHLGRCDVGGVSEADLARAPEVAADDASANT